nr:hypothetical protein GCM10020093_038850 [Planobispora longispora]
MELAGEVTGPLLSRVPAAFHGRADDVLLAGLAAAVARWGGRRDVLVDLEGHGRQEDLFPGADLSRSVGWFTSMHPARIDAGELEWADLAGGGPAAGHAVKRVKEQLRALPGPLGYGLLRYLNPDTAPALAALPSRRSASTTWAASPPRAGTGNRSTAACPAVRTPPPRSGTQSRSTPSSWATPSAPPGPGPGPPTPRRRSSPWPPPGARRSPGSPGTPEAA